MHEAHYCHGPNLARRLYRLSTMIAQRGYPEAASFIAMAALSVCEPADRTQAGACICAAQEQAPRLAPRTARHA